MQALEWRSSDWEGCVLAALFLLLCFGFAF